MSNALPRRSFISRLSLALTSALTLPAFSALRASRPSGEEEDQSPILAVKPMGFQWETVDPFLFCAHHEDKFPKGNDQMGPVDSMKGRSLGDDFIIKDGYRMYHGRRVPGFPGHPHRGFETITIVREGLVDHADSLGAAGRYGNGDVQWMTAGRGVLHSEMFPLVHADKENPLELFQVWLNLPRKNKMVPAHFKMLWADQIPRYTYRDAGGKQTKAEVIAGSLGGKKAPAPPPDSWAADPANGVAVWNIKMEPGATWTMPAAPAGVKRTIYFYQGKSIRMAGRDIPSYHAVTPDPLQALPLQNGSTPAGMLVLQGRPIGEPVIQYGPFVMNTKEEINQTFEEYNRTKFGGWPWARYDQVHPRERGRFARHADGREEVKA